MNDDVIYVDADGRKVNLSAASRTLAGRGLAFRFSPGPDVEQRSHLPGEINLIAPNRHRIEETEVFRTYSGITHATRPVDDSMVVDVITEMVDRVERGEFPAF